MPIALRADPGRRPIRRGRSVPRRDQDGRGRVEGPSSRFAARQRDRRSRRAGRAGPSSVFLAGVGAWLAWDRPCWSTEIGRSPAVAASAGVGARRDDRQGYRDAGGAGTGAQGAEGRGRMRWRRRRATRKWRCGARRPTDPVQGRAPRWSHRHERPRQQARGVGCPVQCGGEGGGPAGLQAHGRWRG